MRQLTLGQLIDKLEAQLDYAQHYRAAFDDGYFHPMGLSSWRGLYTDLAIEFADDDSLQVRTFLLLLKGAIDSDFEGYKGGQFKMHRGSRLWIANYGDSYGFSHTKDKPYRIPVDVVEEPTWISIITELAGDEVYEELAL